MPEQTTPEASTEPNAETPPDASAAQQEIDWKTEARKWEQRAKDNKKALDEAAPKLSQYDQLVAASQTDLERAQGELSRWQEDASRWRNAALSSRVTSLAADFADPEDAIGALGDTSKYLTAGGEIDDKAIQADLSAVLDRKPHWRKPSGSRPPAPNKAQGTTGATNGGSGPADTFATFLRGQLNPH